MTKSELIKKIHRNNDLNYVEIEKIVNEVLKMCIRDSHKTLPSLR